MLSIFSAGRTDRFETAAACPAGHAAEHAGSDPDDGTPLGLHHPQHVHVVAVGLPGVAGRARLRGRHLVAARDQQAVQ